MNRGTLLFAALGVVAATALAAPARAADPAWGTASDDTPAACASGISGCPTGDSFYTAPADLASRTAGAVIGSRAATIAQPGAMPASATTLTYRTNDDFGAPVLGAATLLLPSNPWTGSGARPLVSFQFAEDSLGRQCAPSYALQHANTNSIISAESGDVQTLLEQGYAVVVPDAEGPAEQFIAGRMEGHAVLDGIRAALSYAGSGLTPATRIGLVGYSGGAHATAWAAELAATYAPELAIKGVVEGGTPADLYATGKYNDGAATAGLVLLSAVGLERTYPAAGIYAALNATGRAAFASGGTQCVQAVTAYAGRHLDDYTTAPGFIDTPGFRAVLAHDQLGQAPPATIPIFNYHVLTDEIVPYPQDKILVDTYCHAGVDVTHLELQAGDHFSGEAAGIGPGLTWLGGRFDGAPSSNTCAITNAEPVPPQLPTVAAPSQSLPEAGTPVLLGVAGLAIVGYLAHRRRATR